MYIFNKPYPYHYYNNIPIHQVHYMHNISRKNPFPYLDITPNYDFNFSRQFPKSKDYGPEPFVVNIEDATKLNNTFRTALWTGDNLQLTLMNINPGEDVGLEFHPDLDQFIRIEDGNGIILMGDYKDKLDFQENVFDDYAIIIPAGKWHNIINIGYKPLKLYSLYAPPQHPHGTVHETKSDAQAAEEHNY